MSEIIAPTPYTITPASERSLLEIRSHLSDGIAEKNTFQLRPLSEIWSHVSYGIAVRIHMQVYRSCNHVERKIDSRLSCCFQRLLNVFAVVKQLAELSAGQRNVISSFLRYTLPLLRVSEDRHSRCSWLTDLRWKRFIVMDGILRVSRRRLRVFSDPQGRD